MVHSIETDKRAAILLYNDAQRLKAEAVVHRMVKRAVEMEGTVTVSSPVHPALLRVSMTTDMSRYRASMVSAL